jgi:hypothetical protein
MAAQPMAVRPAQWIADRTALRLKTGLVLTVSAALVAALVWTVLTLATGGHGGL